MKHCPVCNTQLPDDVMHCETCQFSFHPMIGVSPEEANRMLEEKRKAWDFHVNNNPHPHSLDKYIETSGQLIESRVNIIFNLCMDFVVSKKIRDEFEKEISGGMFLANSLSFIQRLGVLLIFFLMAFNLPSFIAVHLFHLNLNGSYGYFTLMLVICTSIPLMIFLILLYLLASSVIGIIIYKIVRYR